MKHISCLILLFFAIQVHAQQAIGTWRTHLSYHNVTQTEPAGDIIYALANGGLFSYNKEDQEVYLFDKINKLNDTNITRIAYNKEYKTLVIIYSNANIDLLVEDKKVYNLPDFMNKIMTYSKEVNSIRFHNEYAYLSTSFGILVINLNKKEIANTYTLHKVVNDCTIDNQTIYAATQEGLFVGKLTDNLLDNSKWKKTSDDVFEHFVLYDDILMGNIAQSGIYRIDKETCVATMYLQGNYTMMNPYEDKLLCGNSYIFLPFHTKDTWNYMELGREVNHMSYANNTYWGAYKESGLTGQKLTDNKMEDIMSGVIPNSPVRNLPHYMKFEGERLFITGGGIHYDRFDNPGTIAMFENNKWSNVNEKAIAASIGQSFRDITSIAQNPKDNEHFFASSAGEGLYEFKEGEFIKLYTMDNSPLETIIPDSRNYIRINGLNYDTNNNLWMLSSETKNSVHVLKEDGNWVSFTFPETTKLTNFEESLFDRRGWFWATSHWIINSGIFCLNTNNTLEDASDDKYKFLTRFTNQDGILLDRTNINCIVEDKNGAIWVGTDKGPVIFNNPSRFFESDVRCTQIKVPRNDGTNLADYLLVNDIINAIAIDGANRKWIGTETNGIYLISEDGLETIKHFTEKNSPLLSNNILSIAIHPRTGEVFIGTNKGLISYQSDATEAEEDFASEIYAYPNPVKPSYDGIITVTGLVRDSDVKIADASGTVIYSGTSVGGQFTWDGKNREGRRVASGVYFVLAADASGKEGIATKILVITGK
ncbi:Por secretion system protein [Bacteroides sp. 214]|uniref:type IX secretion system anionic LPS delivery protein PorZ n=1 Tax=Bacteroides sp. 214 TaxID=2302935 RepID=UPI0013D62FF4|nr:two-component regulator propeller domain-containing protein [Bacteroides sp. 214]NDW12132.1 Por secretion system protein [Bacteroides sp. 214]